MKNSAHFRFGGFFHGSISLAFVLVGLLSWHPAFAENVQEARVTRIVKDVKLVGGNAAARPAVVSDQVRPGNGVRTGTDSRAELTFSDLSITRLGANTVFSFNGAGRTVDLGGGAILVEAPPNSAAIHVNTAAFSAAISGGTSLIEFHPNGISKVMVLEGKGEVGSNGHGGETITVPAGQMITLGPDGKWSKSQKFNVALVMKSANLITDFGALPNEQLIFQVIDQQKNDFGSSPNNQPPHDTTLEDTIDRNDAAPPGEPGGGPTPNPTPSGHVPVITSPNPYIIGSGTNILTDPTITTNGQTDQGVLYRGAALDGPISAFAFDSTSAFDTASGFDLVLDGENGGAAFKFTALQITGNPTVDTTGGPDSLALIAINGITSAGPGGTLTFTGIHGLLIAAQNGSVTLGSELSFSGLHELTIYARGATSDLTLGSNISTEEHANLFAERNMALSSTIQTNQIYAVAGGSMTINGTNTLQAPTITLNSFHDLTWDGETSDMSAGTASGNVTITAGGNINVTNDLSFTRHQSDSEGLNLTLGGGHDVTVGGIFSLVVDNSSGGDIDTGANIAVSANGNLTVNGSSGITLNVLNQGGTIEDGGNISVDVGGDLKAEGLSALINNRNNGSIDHGVSLAVAVGGNLNLDFGSQLEISSRADSESVGGTIDGDALVSVTTGSISGANSDAIWEITNGDGGHIQGNATVFVSVTGNAGFALGGLFDIDNNSFNTLHGGILDGNAVIDFSAANVSSGTGSLNFTIHNQGNGDGAAGQIGGDATITIHAANLASASSDRGDIVGLINNRAGGTITNNAAINLTAAGAVGSTFAGNVNFTIDNDTFGGIGGDASVTAQMASLGAGDSTSFAIDNSSGGFIGGGASVAVTVTGASGVTLPNQATFAIDNGGLTSIQGSIQPQEVTTGIGGDASVTLNVQNGGLSDDDGLEVRIGNGGNSIGGDATISATVANAVQINAGDAKFEILNDGGFIGGSASVSASAGSVTANNVLAQIDNTFGSVVGGANIEVDVAGDVTTRSSNGVLVQLLNEGGQIGGAAGDGLVLNIHGTTNTQALQLYTDNATNGFINNGGNLVLNATGTVVMDGPLGMEVDNFNGGTINNGGNVTAHFHNNISDTSGSMHSFNFFVFNGGDSVFVGPLGGGTIGTGGNIDLTFDGNVATTPTATTGSFGIEIANDNGAITNGGNITVASSGNMTARIVSALISNQNGTITNGANISFNTTGTISSTGFTNFEVINIGGTIGNTPQINVHAGSFNVGTALVADYDNEGGSIGDGDEGHVTLTSAGAITVGTGMWVLGHVTAGGDINVGTMRSTDVTATGDINVGSGGIRPFRFVDGNNTVPDVEHTLTAAHITSGGGINFNGDDSDGEDLPGNGGTLALNTDHVSFDAEGDITGSVTANGGNAAGESPAGDGGSLTVNATGNITANTDIEATTGFQDASAQPSGTGGSVSLNSTGGTVTVNDRIEVSSDDPTPEETPAPPIRRSNSGGNITLTSGKATGTAINVTSSAQLLSLLDNAATGPGGVITVKATGSASAVNVAGQVEADRGIIDVEQTGASGSITLGNTTADGNALTMRADIIKVGALGANGTLTIGKSSLTADTLIALYAGSSGTVDFNANVTLAGATTKIIAGHIVTIDNGVTVTILGAAADVYAHLANYDTAHGGNGSTTGVFSGSVNTHIDGTAPPFGQTSNIASASSTSRSSATRSSNTRTASRTASAASATNQPSRTAPSSALPARPIVLH